MAISFRFTILSQYYPPEIGAAQVRLSAFARELKRLGHMVRVVTAMPNYPAGVIQAEYRGKFWVQETIDTIPVTRTWVYPATGRGVLKRLANYISFTLSCLIGLAITPRGDILFVESPPLFLCLSAWLAAGLRGEKLCLNISDLWPDSVVAVGIMKDGISMHAARRLEKWLYQQAWRVCGVTHGVVKGIRDKGISPEKVVFLPNVVDTHQFQNKPYISRLGEPYSYIYAGTHGYAHGVEVILRAAKLLAHRKDIQFILVGDGADKIRLQVLAGELQLTNLVFLDPVSIDAMPDLLVGSYAAIITIAKGSFFGGTRSAKIFPAMATGRAIIHSGAGEGAEIVLQSQGGIVTQAGDAQALAEAVCHLADNPAETITMGKRGREFVEGAYSWSLIVERWLQVVSLGDEN